MEGFADRAKRVADERCTQYGMFSSDCMTVGFVTLYFTVMRK